MQIRLTYMPDPDRKVRVRELQCDEIWTAHGLVNIASEGHIILSVADCLLVSWQVLPNHIS